MARISAIEFIDIFDTAFIIFINSINKLNFYILKKLIINLSENTPAKT